MKKRKRSAPRRSTIEKKVITKDVKGLDFMNSEYLFKFISERGKILPRSRTGLTAKDQRKLTLAVKRARFLALLPYTVKPE